MADPKVKKKSPADALKSIMPIVIPYAAKMLINLVPAGSKVEDFFVKYKSYWEKVAPAISMLVLQLTNMPDIADDVMAELSAEIARAIKEKYSDGETFKDVKPEKDSGVFPISFAMASLNKDELSAFTVRLQLLNEKQRKKVLALELGGKDATKEFIKVLIALDETVFKAWVDVIAPVTEPKPDSAFEKAVKEGLNEFTQDSKKYFQKDSYFVRLAKQKGLMQ